MIPIILCVTEVELYERGEPICLPNPNRYPVIISKVDQRREPDYHRIRITSNLDQAWGGGGANFKAIRILDLTIGIELITK